MPWIAWWTLSGCAGVGSTYGGGDIEVALADGTGLLVATKRFRGPDEPTMRNGDLEDGPRVFEAREGGWTVALEETDTSFGVGDFGFACDQDVESLSLRIVDPTLGPSSVHVTSADVDAVIDDGITVEGDALEGAIDVFTPWTEATTSGDCDGAPADHTITLFWKFNPNIRMREGEVPDWATE